MQDLTIAIDEIKRATQMRAEVEHLGKWVHVTNSDVG
jgi:hypothetical protein